MTKDKNKEEVISWGDLRTYNGEKLDLKINTGSIFKPSEIHFKNKGNDYYIIRKIDFDDYLEKCKEIESLKKKISVLKSVLEI